MNKSIDITATPPPAAWRQWLQGRRLWLLAGVVAIAIGLWTGWGWLASIGATGLLVSLLPCLAMCALGFCMRRGKGSCEQQTQTGTGTSKST